MNTLDTAIVQAGTQPLPTNSTQPRGEREEPAIRTLQDWELLLAGGGDGNPGWPS
jgi:hypothetical protein